MPDVFLTLTHPTAEAYAKAMRAVQNRRRRSAVINMVDAASWSVVRIEHGQWKWSASVGLLHAGGYAESRESAIARAEETCDLLVAQDKTDA